MNITLIKATARKNSSTVNAAKYFISRLNDVGEVYEFTLPDDMPHICRGCYACLYGNEDKCGGAEYLKPINAAMEKSRLMLSRTGANKVVFGPLRIQVACSPPEF